MPQTPETRKRYYDLLLGGELSSGPQISGFDRFKRSLDELAGEAEGLPQTPREAQMRALQATLGIGGKALSLTDPVDEVVAQAAREWAKGRGHGEGGQALVELLAGAASGIGSGDVGRAGVFATRRLPKFPDQGPVGKMYKTGEKEARDAAARMLQKSPFWRKGTKAGEFMRKYVYQPGTTKGIDIEDVSDTKGTITIDKILKNPTIHFPRGEYTPGSAEKVMGHEAAHFWIRRGQEKALEAGDDEAVEFFRDLKRAADVTPWRPYGSPVRTALGETTRHPSWTRKGPLRQDVIKAMREGRTPIEGVMTPQQWQRFERDLGAPLPPEWRAPHGPDEALVDLLATYGDPGSKEWIPREARDLVDPWLKKADPWAATEPGTWEDILEPIAQAQLKALRKP